MEELNLKQIRLTNIWKSSCLQQSWFSRRDKCYLFGEIETSPEEVVRTIKKSRNGLRQINWCYFVCLSRSDVLYYCFLCPIHVQIYSANLLAPCSFCSVHRSSFPMFGLKLFRKWVSSTYQEPFHKQRQGPGLRAAQWLQRSWQPHSPSRDLAHPLELQRGIGAEKKKVQLQKLL